MKNFFVFTIIIIFPFITNAQSGQSLDIVGSVDYTFRHLKTNNDPANQKELAARNMNERSKFNWRAGLNYNHKISEKLYLKVGIGFSSLGYIGEEIDTFLWPGDILTGDTSKKVIQNYFDHFFLEFPILARYELNNKRLTPFVELGFSPTIYLKTRLKSVSKNFSYFGFENGLESGYNLIHFTAILSIGLNYSLSENYQLFLQPTFRYQFTKLAKVPVEEFLYSSGLEFGIRKKW